MTIPVSLATNEWLGGTNYFRNLCLATNKYSRGRFRLTILTDNVVAFEGVSGEFAHIQRCEEVHWRAGIGSFMSKLSKKWGGADYSLLRKIEATGTDLISHNHAGRQRGMPTLPWIPDFQHKYLPELFQRNDLRTREKLEEITKYFGQVLLSSRSAEQDFNATVNNSKTVRTFVLRFATGQARHMPRTEVEARCRKYDLPKHFFLVANQFWVHKNHAVLIDALRALASDAQIVCTGVVTDPRHPAHVPELMDRARALAVHERFKILGAIPYDDVTALMHKAVAIINPSLFEGWNTAVEEARSLGKRTVLSAIPAHIEQAPPDAVYFSPKNPVELASALQLVLDQYNDEREELRRHTARVTVPVKQEEFVDQYCKIISEAV